MSLLLKNATYINAETLAFSETDLLVEEGLSGGFRFVHSAESGEVADQIINCKGKLVTHAFAVGHHHAYSALARGMPAPPKNPENFYEILKYIWWRLDKALDKEMTEASALATAMACAKAGSTFVIDHHASPHFIEGSLEVIAKAFDKVGVSHLLCYEITDRDGKEKAEQGLAETASYLKDHQGLVGLHASFTVGDETLKKAADLVEKLNSGIHIHVAEDVYDTAESLEKYHMWVVDRINDFGLLNSSKTILAHCLHLDDYERQQVKNSPAWVVENIESNLNNKVGYFNAKGLSDKIMLGTDGMHSDMLRSAQATFFAGRQYDDIDDAKTYSRFRNAHRYLKENGFSGDGDNNLVVLDYDSPTEINQDNFLGHFLFGWNTTHIQHVISNGKLIVKNHVLQTVDEKEVLKFTREQANRLWERLKR